RPEGPADRRPAHAYERRGRPWRAQDPGREEEVGVEDLMAQEKTAETAKKAPEAQPGAKKPAEAQAGDREAAGAEPKAPRRRREKRVVPRGAAHVKASLNNTIVSLTDPAGNLIAWSASGAAGRKGSRKSTPYAAQVAAENEARKALDLGLKVVGVFGRGPGA